MARHDRVVGVVWSICVVVLIGALIAGAVQVFGDFSGEMVYRWLIAAMFLGGALAWLTVYHQDALRRFFKR